MRAIAELAQAETSEQVALAYGIESISFGPEYLIPRPFDPRLIARIAPAVAQGGDGLAAWRRGRSPTWTPTANPSSQFVYHSGLIMKPLFAAAKAKPQAHGLRRGRGRARAARGADRGRRGPGAAGRSSAGRRSSSSASSGSACACKAGRDFELVNPEFDPRYRDYWSSYHQLTERKGVSPEYAKHRDAPAQHADRRDADAQGRGRRHAVRHLRHARAAPALHRPGDRPAPGVRHYAAMNALMLPNRTVFICDTYVTPDPDAEHIAEMTMLAAEEMRRFGIVPKVALLSASNFGSLELPSARKMQRALAHPAGARAGARGRGRDARRCRALGGDPPARCSRSSRLRGEANLLVMPTLDAANIAFNLLKTAAGDGVTIGPILLGAARAGAHPHALGDRAAPRQHDRAHRGRRQRAARRRRAEPLLGRRAMASEARPATWRSFPRPPEAARGAGADRRRRARRLPGGRGEGGARHPRQPGEEPVPDPVRHLGGRDQRRHAGGASPTTSLAAVANLLEVWENMHCHHVYRTDVSSIMRSGARWLDVDDADLARQSDLAARQRAAARTCSAKTMPFERIQAAHRLGRAVRGVRHRLGLHLRPERVLLPGRLAGWRAGSATSASARR